MKFTDYLNEEYTPPQPPPERIHPSQHTKVVTTVFYDADRKPHDIQVEVVVRVDGESVLKISPVRVKYDGKLVKYDRFLQAIPTDQNQALHDPDAHLDTWSAWLE